MRSVQSAFFILLLVSSIAEAGTTPPSTSTFDFSQYEGKVVVIDFWASWCPPCRDSFPWLNAMKRKYQKQGLVIVGVNADQKWSDAERFLTQFPAQFQLLVDSDRSLRDKFSVTGLPTTCLFDRHGNPISTHLGFDTGKREEYEESIRRALAQK